MEAIGKERYIAIRRYNLKELAGIYDISKYKMRNKIKRLKATIGEQVGYFYEYEQVELLFKLEPLPPHIHLIV